MPGQELRKLASTGNSGSMNGAFRVTCSQLRNLSASKRFFGRLEVELDALVDDHISLL